MNDNRVVCTASDNPKRDWPRVRHWLKAAVDATGGKLLLEEVYLSVMLGHSKLWLVKEWPYRSEDPRLIAAVTSSIGVAGDGVECTINFAGGEKVELWAAEAVRVISMDARLNSGSTRTSVIGRRGWQPILSAVGFKPTHTIFTRSERPIPLGKGKEVGPDGNVGNVIV